MDMTDELVQRVTSKLRTDVKTLCDNKTVDDANFITKLEEIISDANARIKLIVATGEAIRHIGEHGLPK